MTQGSLLPLERALEQLLRSVPRPGQCTSISLSQALGRVLAEDQHAGLDVPPADNSAMDGYAVRQNDAGSVVPITQRIAAGDRASALARGTAARIFTGGEIPAGADLVVMQEDVSVDDAGVGLPTDLRAGQNVRRRGQDCRRGELLLAAGRKLLPQDLGLLASQGLTQVPVYPRLRVALLSTGSELREPNAAGDGQLAQGEIYNSNGPMLAALLSALNIEVVDLGIVEDSPGASRAALQAGADQADLIVSSGGVSVGEADYVKDAVSELGELTLWKVAIKPGKPFASGHVAGTPFIGLPGNPSSAFVTFVLLARPALLSMQGRNDLAPAVYPAIADFEVAEAGTRREYLRVTTRLESGVLRVKPYGNQSSGVLRSLTASTALAVVPEERTIERGDTVLVLPLQDLLN